MAQLKLSKKSGAVGAVCSIATIIAIVVSAGNVRTNQRGLELIGDAEGCRRDPYVCPAAVLTDGIGNTHNVTAGVRKTDAQIAADWERNILEAEHCVNSYGNGRKLSDNTFSAVTSITFNAGCGSMKSSTLFRYLRAGDVAQACSQFPRWVYGGGKVLPGLVTRRGAKNSYAWMVCDASCCDKNALEICCCSSAGGRCICCWARVEQSSLGVSVGRT